VKEINTPQDYKSIFSESISPENKAIDKRILFETLQQALKVREFEIELYWKRANYFWAFNAASFAGYFVVISSDNINQYKELTIIVSIIGIIFSLGWYLVNRGSKYWQENWEEHVSMLETEIIGPLFRTVINPKRYSFKKLSQGYPFSVSKVNQILSLTVLLIWVYISIYSIDFTFDFPYFDTYAKEINLVSFSVIILTCLILFWKNAESSLSKDIKSKKDNEPKMIVR